VKATLKPTSALLVSRNELHARELWSLLFDSMARDPELRAAFADGVRADGQSTGTSLIRLRMV